MPGRTKIQWASDTWNPVTGCNKVSAGCKNCYAETFLERWRGLPGHTFENGFDITLRPERLDVPKRWRKPRIIFVNSLSDLFHKDVPLNYIQRVFEVMNNCPQHIFQVLTKRHERLLELAPRLQWGSNIWMGVSVEDLINTNRVDYLRDVPAAVRFLSIEPLIGPIRTLYLDGISWVIVGGESGPGARPMDTRWVEQLIALCSVNDVPVFVKQLGSVWAKQTKSSHPKGGDMNEWPEVLRVRQYPKGYEGRMRVDI